MIIKLPVMEKHEIQKIIQDQILCRIAFKDSEYPYIAPFQYVYLNGSLYFQFTNYGKKMKLLDRDNRVCVEIEKIHPDLSEYYFVSLRGKLNIVKNSKEREEVVRRMAEEGKKKFSENFLTAHGLNKNDGWSSFTPEKPLIIVKLNVVNEIGIKSP